MLFIESRAFRRRMEALLSEDELGTFQQELVAAPTRWPVIRGSGGARKARVAQAARGKGTRGGVRVIYLYVPTWEHIHLLVIYGKHEADDLSPDELATVRSLVKATLEEYRRRKP